MNHTQPHQPAMRTGFTLSMGQALAPGPMQKRQRLAGVRRALQFTLLLSLMLCLFDRGFTGEADVVAVTVEPLGDGRYRVSVSLQHEDSGWDHYANRWDILDEAGTLLGSRELLHPHVDEQPFTRSLTLFIPESVRIITVRGADSVHAEGGITMTTIVPNR